MGIRRKEGVRRIKDREMLIGRVQHREEKGRHVVEIHGRRKINVWWKRVVKEL